MVNIQQISNLTDLKALKHQYFAQATAALDGMWHFGFVPNASHFGFFEGKNLLGYCAINTEGYLLQFYLAPEAKIQAEVLFSSIINDKNSFIGAVKGAFVSTAESHYLSLCLDNTSVFKVNALMFKENKQAQINPHPTIEMTLAQPDQLNDFITFAVAAIGAPKEWLTGYYGNLIKRNELWGYWCDNKIVASGECRLFDEQQTSYADLGMIVAPSERGKGLATRIVNFLKQYANNQGLTAICSTESSNIAAQKAIIKAGFITQNRIIQFDFA